MNSQQTSEDATIERLNAEIDFYEKSQQKCRYNHRLLSTIEVICAALITAILAVPVSQGDRFRTAAAFLGAIVLTLKGIRGVYQYQETWLRHKTTWVALDNERTLYLAKAGHYRSAYDPIALLAETITVLVGGEVRDFIELQRRPPQSSSTEQED